MKFLNNTPGVKGKTLLLLAITMSYCYAAQIIIPITTDLKSEEKTWFINSLLDSVINKAVINKGGIICINENSISVDTITLSKVKRLSSDSVILGKFLKKNQKKISSKEFWGLITDSGERRRFYKDKMYVIWERPSPYIYKVDNNWITSYYFSETLISPVMSLDKMSVDSCSLDSRSKEVLYNFIRDNYLGLSNADRKKEDVIVEVSADVINILFQVMFIYLDSNSGSHSNSGHHSKSETGRRK